MAMSNQLAKILEVATTEGLKLLECPVCLEKGQLKLLTSCGHNICQICETRLATNNNQIKCPLCNTVTTRPPGGLINNYQLIDVGAHLDDALNQWNQLSLEMRHKCDQCGRSGLASDVVRCFTCQDQTLCGNCAFLDHSGHKKNFLSNIVEEEERSRRLQKTLNDLPDKALKGVFRFLSAKDVVRGHLVCHRWDQVISDNCHLLPKTGIHHPNLSISFNGRNRLVRVYSTNRTVPDGSMGLSPRDVPVQELPTLAKMLRHFRVSTISLDLSHVLPDVFSIVVDQLLQPSLSFQLTSIALWVIRLRHPAILPVAQSLLQGIGHQLRELEIKIDPCVAPLVNDELIQAAVAGGRLTNLCLGSVPPCDNPQLQCRVTDAIFDAVDVQNFRKISFRCCRLLTLNGLQQFLQRWVDAGRQGSRDGVLSINRCSQLTPAEVEQRCRRLPVSVAPGATTPYYITIRHSQQLAMTIHFNVGL